jgi:starch-binding outer membrane protein, SusD/RagB family
MKKSNLYKYASAFMLFMALGSCSDDFLEPSPRGRELESNYYKNADHAFAALTAAYDVVGWQGGNLVTKEGATMAASDDHGGGGEGNGDMTFVAWDTFTLSPASGPQGNLWSRGYSGIFRANKLIEKLPDIPMGNGLRDRYTAEMKFLRAYFHFDLIRFFKNIPLLTKAVSPDEMYDVLQAAPEEVYAQIETDLADAIAVLPETVPSAEAGRATKGAAIALLGKVYLQQEKFVAAAEKLAEVNGTTPGSPSPFGYDLLDNFGDLWQSTAPFKFNKESIFEKSHTNQSKGRWESGGAGVTEGNMLNIMVGPRGYSRLSPLAPDYVSGWSYFPITQSLVDAMTGDPRFVYTIADLNEMKADGIANFTAGAQNTGYFLEKFAGKTPNRSDNNGQDGNYELNFPQNMYEIRLADTYLMEAEALVRGNADAGTVGTRSYNLLNAVRARVGLSAINATLENIKRERRLDLAGEGHRWFDLVRWGDAANALASMGFVEGKHEVLPIPINEMNNTKIEQNKEWGGTK